MYKGLLQIHVHHTHKLWYQMWGWSGWGTLRRCLNVPQNCLKVPQWCLKVTPNCLKVPPLFQALQHLALANSRLMQQIYVVFKFWFHVDPRCLQVPNMVSQGTPVGVSRCSSTRYIETYFWKYVLLKNESLHNSENCHLLLKYTPPDNVWVVKMFYF